MRRVRTSARAAEHFDAILFAIKAGAPLTLTCRQHGITLLTLQRHARADPDRQNRYEAAVAAGGQGASRNYKRKAEMYFDEILKLIEGGLSFDRACQAKPDFPSRHVFYAWMRNDPARLRRLNAAFCARSKGGDGRSKFRPADYNRALDLLRSRPAETVEKVLDGKDPAMPPAWAVRHRARTRPDFGARFAEVMRKRAALQVTIERGRDDLHRRSLGQNEMHRLAAAAVPRGLEPPLRDDMIAEIVVALVDGTIHPDELKSRKREITRDAHARVGPRTYVSLDAAGPYGRRLVDSLSSDQWIPA